MMSDYDPEASATRLASCVESEDGGHLVDGRLGLLPPPGHGESTQEGGVGGEAGRYTETGILVKRLQQMTEELEVAEGGLYKELRLPFHG